MIERLADILVQAQETRVPCDPLPDLTLDEAYAVQHEVRRRRLLRPGAAVVGQKIGVTSAAVQQWLGLHHPDVGSLLDDMEVADGGETPTAALIQPRAEGEIVFVLRCDVLGPGVTVAQVVAATDFVLPAIEVIDSRIRDWKLKASDTVADNASCGLFVVGTRPARLADVDLVLCGMTLRHNGRVAATGAGAACMGNPVNAVVWLANHLGARGVPLRAGEVILSGALGPVVKVAAGDHVEVAISGLGSVSLGFT